MSTVQIPIFGSRFLTLNLKVSEMKGKQARNTFAIILTVGIVAITDLGCGGRMGTGTQPA